MDLATQDIILENESVRLRRLQTDDYQYLEKFVLFEPEIWQFSLVSLTDPKELIQYIDTALKLYAQGTEYPFIVFDKQTQQYAGCTLFYDIQTTNKTLHLGYTWYGKNFQGTGLNKNCKFLLLQFAFEKLQMERVEFKADNRNKKSIAALKSIGCTQEGILRSHLLLSNGERRDSIVLSILKKEWSSGVKENLIKKISLCNK